MGGQLLPGKISAQIFIPDEVQHSTNVVSVLSV